MTTPITAASELHHAPQEVFDFLADLRNHALLSPGSVQLRSPDPHGGVPIQAIVRLCGSLAICRTATTAIVDAGQPAVVAGRARIGKRPRASISWTIAGRGKHANVSLRVIVEETGFLDGVLLRLGGRRWLHRRFADALACVADQLAAVVSPNVCSVASLRPRPALQPAA
jgi:hypothetical protein